MSAWRQVAKTMPRSQSHRRKAVACLTCSPAWRPPGRGDRLDRRATAQSRQDFPGDEAAHELGVLGVAEVGEVADQPPLEGTDLLVDDREHAARHQQVSQVSGCPPGLHGVEGLVGQCYLTTAQAPQ